MSSSSTVPASVFSSKPKTPLWLWPNLLSLDAPIISALWQDLFARDAGVTLTLASRAALPLTVWLIYLLDRLFDSAGALNHYPTARHAFYRAHRSFGYLLTAFIGSALAISVLHLPAPVLKNGLLVLAMVAVYLWIVHRIGGHWFPKEATVGLLFAAGTVLAPFTRATPGFALLPPAILLGVLCWLNCSAIEIWEGGRVDAVSAWLVRNMRMVVLTSCLLSTLLALQAPEQHSWLALLISSIGFWAFADQHATENRTDALRVWVDIPLLTPLLLIGLK